MFLKKINFVTIYMFITLIVFMLYEEYLGTIIMFFNIPFVPHMRDTISAIIKYIPVMFILVLVYITMDKIQKNKKIHSKKE